MYKFFLKKKLEYLKIKLSGKIEFLHALENMSYRVKSISPSLYCETSREIGEIKEEINQINNKLEINYAEEK